MELPHNIKYEVRQKSNETDFFIYQGLYFFQTSWYNLQNSSLGHLHTDGDVVPTFASSAGSLQLR